MTDEKESLYMQYMRMKRKFASSADARLAIIQELERFAVKQGKDVDRLIQDIESSNNLSDQDLEITRLSNILTTLTESEDKAIWGNDGDGDQNWRD